MRFDPGRQDRAGFAKSESMSRGRVGEHLGRFADSRYPSVFDDHDCGGKTRDLGRRMTDIEYRQADLIAQPLEIGQDLRLSRLIERGQGFVHQQEPWLRQDRPPERDPALLAARESGGSAIEKRFNPEEFDDPIELTLIHLTSEPGAIGQVRAHAHMRKQPRFLEHVTDSPLVWRQGDAVAGVRHDHTIERNSPDIGLQ